MADIELAFLNIRLTPEDAKVGCFLWVEDPMTSDLIIRPFQRERVSFGLAPSPYLLRAVLKKHLKLYESKYPRTTQQLKHQLYVDDYLGGADDLTEANTMVEETLEICRDASMRMRNWTTNEVDLRTPEPQWIVTPSERYIGPIDHRLRVPESFRSPLGNRGGRLQVRPHRYHRSSGTSFHQRHQEEHIADFSQDL